MLIEYIAILIPFAGMALGGWIAYYSIKTNHAERIAMIEQGMDPRKKESQKKKRNSLRTGLLFMFVPFGIIIGNVLNSWIGLGMSSLNAGTLFGFLFGGVALTGAYFITEEEEEQKTDESDY